MLIYLQMIENNDDKDKFEQLYMKYRSLMYQSALSILQNNEDAEDVVHQAFISIIENIDKVKAVDAPETRSFCVLCCKNKALDLYRKKKRWGEVQLIDNLTELAAPDYDGRLDMAIAKLPLTLGTVVLLHYDNGFTIEEIAEILGITVVAARKRLTRAKNELRKTLREERIIE